MEVILNNLISADNDTRKHAEEQFAAVQRDHPDQYFGILVQQLVANGDIALRSLCAVLIRKRLNNVEFTKLAAETRALVTSQLLISLQQEQNRGVRRKISDCVGEVSSAILFHDAAAWPDLLPTLLQMGQSPSPDMRETAMNVFSTLAFSISEQLTAIVPAILPLIKVSLVDVSSLDVRIAAAKAASSIVQILGRETRKRNELLDLLAPMMETLTTALNTQQELSAKSIIEELTNIAELAPAYFKQHIGAMLQVMQQLALTDTLEEGTRLLAVEFLATLAEKSPVMCRKCPNFISGVVGVGLHLMLADDDEVSIEDWNKISDDDDENSEDTNELVEVGKELLDRLSMAMKHKDVFDTAFTHPNLVPLFLDHPDWKHRYAALYAITQMAEGCEERMMKDLKGVVSKIIEKLHDADPRVRWCAINAMGQLATDLGPSLQIQCHQLVLPALVMVMNDVANPRVQSHAAAAVINFTEKCTKDILAPYLASLLERMGHLLSGASRRVTQNMITAIASIADCVQDKFIPHYDQIIPLLKYILQTCTTKEDRKLRGKAIECMSIISVAVGRDKFMPDAQEFTQIMLHQQQQITDADDPQTNYILQAWGRIGKCLGDQFGPFLPLVMPPLLKAAAMEPEEIDVDAEEEDEDEDDEEDHVATVMVGDKRIGIRTSALEDKSTACNMIVCYFFDLQDMMYPFAAPVAQIMLPLLRFAFSEDVRGSAAALMPELIKCVSGAAIKGQCGAEEVNKYRTEIIANLLDCLKSESDLEVLLNLLDALQEVISVGGENVLTEAQFAAIMEIVTPMVTEARAHADEHNETKKSEEFDEDMAEQLEEEAERDMQVMDNVDHVICALAKTHKPIFMHCFQPFLPVYGAMLTAERPPIERRVGLCVFDDILEQLGPLAKDYMPTIYPFLLQYCADEDAEVRQAAVYGLGVLAQHGQQFFVEKSAEIIHALRTIIQHPSSRDDDNEAATDNAVSALFKCVEYQHGVIDANAALCTVLSYLPFNGDVEEGKAVNGRLATMLEHDLNAVLGQDLKWLPRLVQIIAESLDTETVDETITARFVALLHKMQTSIPNDTLQHAFGMLSQDNKTKLLAAMHK